MQAEKKLDLVFCMLGKRNVVHAGERPCCSLPPADDEASNVGFFYGMIQ